MLENSIELKHEPRVNPYGLDRVYYKGKEQFINPNLRRLDDVQSAFFMQDIDGSFYYDDVWSRNKKMHIKNDCFYSYQTVIAKRYLKQLDNGDYEPHYLIFNENHSFTTSRHLWGLQSSARDTNCLLIRDTLVDWIHTTLNLGMWEEVDFEVLEIRDIKLPNYRVIKGEVTEDNKNAQLTLFRMGKGVYLQIPDNREPWDIDNILKLPLHVDSIEMALDKITPIDVQFSRHFFRQGEWFFVPYIDKLNDVKRGVWTPRHYDHEQLVSEWNSITQLRETRLVRSGYKLEPNSSHFSTKSRINEQGTIIHSGTVFHENRDHLMLTLGKGWYRAIKSQIEGRSANLNDRGFRGD